MDNKHSKIELIIQLVLIGSGMISGIVFFVMGYYQLSSVLFAIAIASILYRFLGGLGEENSLGMGAIKLSGSAAVLGGFIYLLNGTLSDTDIRHLVEPHGNWIPVNPKTGGVVSVVIADSIRIPADESYVDLRKSNRLEIAKTDKDWFVIQGASGDTIGKVEGFEQDLSEPGLNIEGLVKDDIFSFTLTPFQGNQSSRNSRSVPEDLFFEVRVVNCRCEIWENETKKWDQSMSSGGGIIKFLKSPEDGTAYMLYLVSADCEKVQDEEVESTFTVVRFAKSE